MNKVAQGSIADRMKENYENRSKTYLTRRIPVIIRLDMKAGSSYTSHFYKPFDDIYSKTMEYTAYNVAKDVQSCRFVYTQSDEISLLLRDDFELNTEAYFDYNVQKIVSITSALATYYFNYWMNQFWDSYNRTDYSYTLDKLMREFEINIDKTKLKENSEVYDPYKRPALFDSRAFNIPKEEVCNYFIWRQQDASRNSIYMLARSLFSHKELQGLNGKQLQDKMFEEKGVNWNDLPTRDKRGMCFYKGNTVEDRGWNPDENIPIFTQDRDYIEKFIK